MSARKVVPQPQTARKSRLLTVYPEERRPSQDCGVCRNQANCWQRGIKPEHVITNMLVCRIKRGIDVNRSSRLFLQMVRPVLKKFAKKAVAGTNIDIGTALADLESQTILYLQRSYVMGERGYPLHYLFGKLKGVIRHYANNYARHERKFEERHVLENGQESESGEPKLWDLQQVKTLEEPENDTTRAARAIVDDGVTLTLPEYRVLKFCLSNAAEAKRPLNGLHVFLARTMGVVRARVTKIYSDSCKKMVAEVRSTR